MKGEPSDDDRRRERNRLQAELESLLRYGLTPEEAAEDMGGTVKNLRDDHAG